MKSIRMVVTLWKFSFREVHLYSRLSLSRIPRDSLKHFEISVPRNIRVAKMRKTINRTTSFNKWICNLTPEVRNILKILWKRGEIAPLEQFLLFSTIFCYLFLDFHVKTATRISLRDKQLFEMWGRDNESQLYIISCTVGNFVLRLHWCPTVKRNFLPLNQGYTSPNENFQYS